MEKYIFDVLLKTDVVVRDRHDHTGAVCPDGLVALWARETLWPMPSEVCNTLQYSVILCNNM